MGPYKYINTITQFDKQNEVRSTPSDFQLALLDGKSVSFSFYLCFSKLIYPQLIRHTIPIANSFMVAEKFSWEHN